MPNNWWYAGVDVLILLGVTGDLIMTKRVHPVYLYGPPAMMLGHARESGGRAALAPGLKNGQTLIRLATYQELQSRSRGIPAPVPEVTWLARRGTARCR